ncbi:MAG: hypothetical protein IPP57_14110 [Candidatus Obscuribacter sp.]|nr:hypothetical protein [Candidatus Obscuribacter sp.]MBK9200861.1 hypothetical protein [Candidatus Obscuribacter sp.]MBK9771930.1 hypothetical protein [Candidatus Obscuribacter sp.]MBL0186119.1 hypothetical protein [Candidatus Obscuribacter sp.]MBP6350939.1 hypothetical protein [Candidatus Obscuribacter sp.]
MSKFNAGEKDYRNDQSDFGRTLDSLDGTETPPLTNDQLAGYRAGDFNNLACGIERGDGAARSSLIGSVEEANSQGLLEKSLNNLEQSGTAKVVRDQFGQPKEIVIDPSCGPYDRGTTTKLELGVTGEVKVDGRDSKSADAERTESARQYSDAMVENSFLRKGEKPLNAEQKEQTRAFNHAILDGDPQKLSEAVKSILKNPENAERILSEHDKSFGVYAARLTEGKSPSVEFGDYDHRTLVDRDGKVTITKSYGDQAPLTQYESTKALASFAQTASRSMVQAADLQNEYDKNRTAKVNTPAGRAANFAKVVQEIIDYDKD